MTAPVSRRTRCSVPNRCPVRRIADIAFWASIVPSKKPMTLAATLVWGAAEWATFAAAAAAVLLALLLWGYWRAGVNLRFGK